MVGGRDGVVDARLLVLVADDAVASACRRDNEETVVAATAAWVPQDNEALPAIAAAPLFGCVVELRRSMI